MDRQNIQDLPTNIRSILTLNPQLNRDTIAKYDPRINMIELNPEHLKEALKNPTLAEEFWHKRQDRIMASKGLPLELLLTPEVNRLYETGIIPIVRDLALREGEEWANYEFFRYAMYAAPLAEDLAYNRGTIPQEVLSAIDREKLFEGVGWVYQTINRYGTDAAKYIKETALKDPSGKSAWGEIKTCSKTWSTDGIALQLPEVQIAQ